MLKLLKIAMAQMEVVPGHPDVNTATILRFIEEARTKGADVVIFPEMAVPGYFLGDTWEQSAFLRDCESYGRDIIAASKDITVMFGNVAIDWQKKNNDGRVRKYNAFFIARDGELIQPDNMPYPYTIKTLMPNYREFDDTRHFFSLQKLARELGVSRQIIVGDISILRAEGTQIFATPRGYIMPQEAGEKSIKATIVCRHDAAAMEKELQAVVDNGGSVLDVIVEHPVYGAIRGDLFVESRRDVKRFLTKMQKCQANPLLVVTGGIHMHTIRVPDEEALAAIRTDLKRLGILVDESCK